MVRDKKEFAYYTKQEIIKGVISQKLAMSILLLMIEKGYTFSNEDMKLLSGSNIEYIIVSYRMKKQPLL